VMLDFRVALEENVYPMIPQGKGLDEIVYDPLELQAIEASK